MMNYIVAFILGVIGYVSYPMFFGEEKGFLKSFVYASEADKKVVSADPKVPVAEPTEVVAVVKPPVANNSTQPQQDPNAFSLDKIIASDYPKSCVMIQSGKAMLTGGSAMNLSSGDSVTPVSFSKDKLTVKLDNMGGMEAVIPVAKTNFLKLAVPRALKRLNPNNNSMANNGPNTNAPAVPNTQPQTQGETADPMVKTVNPPNNSGQEAKPNKALSDSDAKKLVSDQFGSLKTLQGSTVRTVKIVGNESIGGKTYQVGEVFFEKETLIGSRRLTAKALISNGTITKWVWLKSNQEIK